MASLAELVARRTTPLLALSAQGETAAAALRHWEPRCDVSGVAVSLQSHPLLLELLIALDGRIDRILLLSGHASGEDVERLAVLAGCELVLSDRPDIVGAVAPSTWLAPAPGGDGPAEPRATRWLLTTSGTTGPAKIVEHSLTSLTRAIRTADGGLAGARWGLVYDPTRFAGLQVVLQSVLGDGTLICPLDGASVAEAVGELADRGCDHLSATPSLWRRILMHPRCGELVLRRATLGGEAADDGILRAVAKAFPGARISHIYASSEAGVGFTVTDGLAGFPSRYLERGQLRGVELKISEGMLWLRAEGAAASYVGAGVLDRDHDGFICSGDLVESDGDRVRFLGRRGSGVNVGGVTVIPEEVEAVLYRHPRVLACRVSGRANPVTGALLTAEVVPGEGADEAALRAELSALCKAALVREAVPRRFTMVEELTLSAAGKVER